MWYNVTRYAIASTSSIKAAVVVMRPVSIVNLASLIDVDHVLRNFDLVRRSYRKK